MKEKFHRIFGSKSGQLSGFIWTFWSFSLKRTPSVRFSKYREEYIVCIRELRGVSRNKIHCRLFLPRKYNIPISKIPSFLKKGLLRGGLVWLWGHSKKCLALVRSRGLEGLLGLEVIAWPKIGIYILHYMVYRGTGGSWRSQANRAILRV